MCEGDKFPLPQRLLEGREHLPEGPGKGRSHIFKSTDQSKEGMYVVRAGGTFFSARKYRVYAEMIPTVIKEIKRTSATLFFQLVKKGS